MLASLPSLLAVHATTTRAAPITISDALATATTTTLSSNVNPSVFGQDVTFTAAVSCPGYTPTGTVTFVIDGAPQTPVALTSGVAAFTIGTLSVAGSPHSIGASYSGDANCATSIAVLSGGQVVSENGAGVVLSSNANPSMLGQTVILTATVSCPAFTPTGFVTFTVDGTAQAPVVLIPVNGQQQAAVSTAALGFGQHTIGASYSGDTNCVPSSATPLTQTVQSSVVGSSIALTSGVALTSSANPSTAGQVVTFTATVNCLFIVPGDLVTPAVPIPTPTGTVTFSVDGTPLAAVTIGGGSASFSMAGLNAGSHTIGAAYSGDVNCAASTATPLTQQITGLTLIINGFTLSFAVQGCGSITPASEAGFHFFGDTMLLTAVPCSGSTFSGWLTGPCAGNTVNPCSVAMPPNNLVITAGFNP